MEYWAVHESEEKSDDKDHPIESVEDSDASLSPSASDSEDIDLEIEINKSINEKSCHIVDDSLYLTLVIGITFDGLNIL